MSPQASSVRGAEKMGAEHNSRKIFPFLMNPMMKLHQQLKHEFVTKSHFLEDSDSTRLPNWWRWKKKDILEKVSWRMQELINLTI